MLIEQPLLPGERRIVTVPAQGRTFYVLGTWYGVVVYEQQPGSRPYADVNHHSRIDLGCMSQAEDRATCEFLAHTHVCWFDGTSLAPAQDDADGIWKLLAARAWPAPEGEPEPEPLYDVTLTGPQLKALVAAAERCEEIWDGTAPEDIAEQDALKSGLIALANAERNT